MKDLYYQNKLETTWKEAWAIASFRRMFLLGSGILFIVLYFYPHFFNFIQNRKGVILHDWLLAVLPSVDVSGYIFFLICVSTLIGLYSSLQSPYLFLIFLWGYLLLSLSRLITITLIPLEPPIGLLTMSDPIAFPFYGQQGGGITKDLFYSGHTGAMFLVFLVVRKKWEKTITLLCTILIGILLLVQHIHYTLDVMAAPLFVYGIYLFAKKMLLTSYENYIKANPVLKIKTSKVSQLNKLQE